MNISGNAWQHKYKAGKTISNNYECVYFAGKSGLCPTN